MGDGATWIDQSNPNAPHEAGFPKLDCSLRNQTFGWQSRWGIAGAVEQVTGFEELRLRSEAVGAEMDAEINAYQEKTC